jgi:predicted DNA-binding protein
MPKIVRTPQIQTRLSKDDNTRIDRLSVMEKKTKAQITRDAIRWYLHNYEQLKNEKKESEYAKEIRKMTDRICAMLYGVRLEIGTLYHLTFNNMTDPKEFEAALNHTRQRIVNKLTEEEKQIVDRQKKIINP